MPYATPYVTPEQKGSAGGKWFESPRRILQRLSLAGRFKLSHKVPPVKSDAPIE
jgi:hypothetical protein